MTKNIIFLTMIFVAGVVSSCDAGTATLDATGTAAPITTETQPAVEATAEAEPSGDTASAPAACLLHKETINDAFHHWRAREITIETDQPQPIQGDGEIWGTTPISIKVLPGAMWVLVPGEQT